MPLKEVIPISPQLAPTKGNLAATKRSLEIATKGYEMLDRKRHILSTELLQQLDDVKALRSELSSTFSAAYQALQRANLSLGMDDQLVASVPIENRLSIVFRSVMGVEIPYLKLSEENSRELPYSISSSNIYFDEAYAVFKRVLNLFLQLTQVEITVYRLTEEIRKTQKRANALQNIIIPENLATIARIADALEEKEREEFVRLKMIKK